MASAASASGSDLLIVGPGVLGSYLGKMWKEQQPAAIVTGQTNSTANHERWELRAPMPGAGSRSRRPLSGT